jgi:uronate dehydrogenase
MNILVTGAATPLGRAVAAKLAPDHRLRLLDDALDPEVYELGDQVEFVEGTILDDDTVLKVVRGMDAVIHTGEPLRDLPVDGLASEQLLLDLYTRGTHMLFKAAVGAGVKKLVYGSTLEIFNPYPNDVYISENFKPLPSPEINQMARYLGECVCKEFARDHRVTVSTLRLGNLVMESEVTGQEPDLMWLDFRDAAAAFCLALERDDSNAVQWTRRLGVFHICADITNPRYLIDQAKKIGYDPAHNFESNWKKPSVPSHSGGQE